MKKNLLCGAPCTFYDIVHSRSFTELSAIAESLFEVNDRLPGCVVLTNPESVEVWNYTKFCDIHVFVSGETFNIFDVRDLVSFVDSLPAGYSFSYLSHQSGQIVLKFCYHFS